jgi:hypothetical protein
MFVYLLVLPLSFLLCISVSAKYSQIIRRIPYQYVMLTKLFGALPPIEVGVRWRCTGYIDGEGDGVVREMRGDGDI